MNEIEKQLSIIKRNTVEIIEENELKSKIEKALVSNIPLRVKYGIDPTAPDIHLGHTVPIKKLKDFQTLGHKIFFLIGDFTAKIGDPTGRNETRPILSDHDIQNNLSRYKQQVGKILDLEKTEFVYNSQWLAPLKLESIIKLTSVFTVAQILEREDFSRRYRENKPIYMQEFLYPLLQGYDSVALKADIEVGATEQKFNLLAGRTIQEAMGQPKQVVITMPILVGTDGRMKMSKSYNNYIPIEIEPREMFGKIMSISDRPMEEYYKLLTDVEERIFKPLISTDPRQAKAKLAKEIVKEYFGEEKARESAEEFDRIFKEQQAPSDISDFFLEQDILDNTGCVSIVDLIYKAGLAPSKSEARRLIIQKSVKMDQQTITDVAARLPVKDGQVLRVGKRKFIKIKIK